MLIQKNILKREYIHERLKNIFNYPLSVVVAAMGYGKTTSVKDFLNQVNAKYIWLSIENDESSPQHIWDSLTRQLAKINPESGKKLNELGFPVDAPQRNRVLKLIDDYTYMTDTILVIDNYHFAHSRELDRFIELLVKTNIKGFHILILSRTRPEFNIEELMLKGYCYQLKSDLFELSQREIKAYFELYGCDVSADIIRQVYEISEGWISAVYLLMQRYIEFSKLEPGENIERLIEKAIMSRYTAIEKRVIISLCIADSFTIQQAVYVTDNRATEQIIQKLSRDNSFIRYDEQNDVYRIHNIFNNYLKKVLDSQLSDIEVNRLHKRSGEWLIKNEGIIAGLKHFLKAEEYDLIMAEFEKRSITKIIDNNPTFILNLFKHIPDEIKYKYPIGYINYASFYVTNVDKDGGRLLLSAIEKYYLNNNDISPAIKKRVAGEIELIRNFLEFNDVRRMHEKLSNAFKLLDGNSVIANGDKITTFGSPHILYTYYREKGSMPKLVESIEETFHYYEKLSNGSGSGFEYQARAEYLLEIGDFNGAKIYVYKAMYKAKIKKQTDIIICTHFLLARLFMAQGRFEKAMEIIDDLNVDVENCNSHILSSAYDLCAGYVGGIIGEDESFAQWLKSGDIEQSDILYPGMGFNYIVYAKSILLEKNYIKLEVLCEEMLKIFSKFNNLLGYLHAYILNAVAKYKLYGMNQAKDVMKSAIELGREDNIVILLAEYNVHIQDVLKELQKDTVDDEYLERIVEYTCRYCDHLKKFKYIKLDRPSLTNREKELLKLIIEGKTNREIASKLFIAEVTVKKNITILYRKLKVTRRASAVKKAIELKMI